MSAVWSVALCAPVTLQGRRCCSGDAAAVLRLHSTFVHSGNNSRHLMSSNVHTESILVVLLVLRLCYINRVQLRLQLRDETALQLLPKFC